MEINIDEWNLKMPYIREFFRIEIIRIIRFSMQWENLYYHPHDEYFQAWWANISIRSHLEIQQYPITFPIHNHKTIEILLYY